MRWGDAEVDAVGGGSGDTGHTRRSRPRPRPDDPQPGELRPAGRCPLFLWLFLGVEADGWAVAVLAIGGTSDWVDGFLARRLGQVSRLGEMLDPLADRLYILATLLARPSATCCRGGSPSPCWPGRRCCSSRSRCCAGTGTATPVHYIGKTATFILLVAFPTLLAAAVPSTHAWAYPCGWALAWWGLVLYWVAAGFYLVQTAGAVREARA